MRKPPTSPSTHVTRRRWMGDVARIATRVNASDAQAIIHNALRAAYQLGRSDEKGRAADSEIEPDGRVVHRETCDMGEDCTCGASVPPAAATGAKCPTCGSDRRDWYGPLCRDVTYADPFHSPPAAKGGG